MFTVLSFLAHGRGKQLSVFKFRLNLIQLQQCQKNAQNNFVIHFVKFAVVIGCPVSYAREWLRRRLKVTHLLASYCALLKIANCKGISLGHYKSLNTTIRVLTKQQQNNYQWQIKISLLTTINCGYQHVTIVT